MTESIVAGSSIGSTVVASFPEADQSAVYMALSRLLVPDAEALPALTLRVAS